VNLRTSAEPAIVDAISEPRGSETSSNSGSDTPAIPEAQRTDATVNRKRCLEMLAELATERARLVNTGRLDLHDAIDGLQYLADAWGLPQTIGADEVQRLLGEPFRSLPIHAEATA
jgi:hypothetical protein